MNFQLMVYIGIFFTLVLDLITLAARSGLGNVNLAKVLHIREQAGEGGERILKLVNLAPRPYAGMHFFQTICRFLLIGLILNLVPWGNDNISNFRILVVLVLAGIFVALMEWVVERLVSQDPENWVKNILSAHKFKCVVVSRTNLSPGNCQCGYGR